jgi:Cu/Zn superoxide dismutase
MTTRTTIVGGLAAAALVTGLATAAAATAGHNDGYGTTNAVTRLGELNKSDAKGTARVKLHGDKATVTVYAKGLLAKAPHAMHIHAGAKGTCPTMAADTNGDRIVSTTEGHHAYGHIVVSLTTRGDTSPASGLAVDRFPATSTVKYERTVTVSAGVAQQIRKNNAVIVVHGIDRNRNGAYDFSVGKSDLDPKLPLEATSPALCGALKVQNGR